MQWDTLHIFTSETLLNFISETVNYVIIPRQ